MKRAFHLKILGSVLALIILSIFSLFSCTSPSIVQISDDEVHYTVIDQNSVTIDWRGSDNSLRYGTTAGYGQTVTANQPNPVPYSSSGPYWEAKLTNLQANTTYHYSIGGSPDYTFKTALPKGSSNFTVDVIADVGDSTSYSNMGPIQQMIASDQPDFVLLPGDITYGESHGLATIDQHFNDVMAWSVHSAAYMPAWGNHEWENPSGDDLRNYKGRFDWPNPQTSPNSPAVSCCGKDWYWFDYGNVRFIAYPEPWSRAWVDWNNQVQPIMAAAQADSKISYIVTFGHRPAYSSGHHPGSESSDGTTTMTTVMDSLGATYSKYVLNLNGHSHDYERTYPQHGVVHITSGTGGGGLEQDDGCNNGTSLWLMCTPPSWSARRYMRQGFTKLVFTANGIQGSYICGPAGGGTNDINCTPGQVIDSFTIGSAGSIGDFAVFLPVIFKQAVTDVVGFNSNLITDPNLVVNTPLMSKPAYLATFIDPTYHTTLTRITGNSNTPFTFTNSGGAGIWGADVRQHYIDDQPWNADQSLLMLQNSGSPDLVILDGNSYLPKYNKCNNYDNHDDRWHPDPAHKFERINVNGSKLEWFDVVNCVQTRVWELPFSAQNDFGQNPSRDGRFAALWDNTRVFVVDMDPQPPLPSYQSGNKRIGPVYDFSNCGLSDCSVDRVAVSPSGKYIVMSYTSDHLRVFDIDPNTLAVSPHPEPSTAPECLGHDPSNGYLFDVGHQGMTFNPFDNNEEVVVGQNRDWCPQTVNGVAMGQIIMVRLKDGMVTTLTKPGNEASAYHISTQNTSRPGWIYASYWPGSGERFNDEIIAVKLDGSQSVQRFIQDHTDTTNCYRCESHPTPSRDGLRVIFASSWTLNCDSACGLQSNPQAYIIDAR